jgi:quercetin dioxygenase-like cupin family protein
VKIRVRDHVAFTPGKMTKIALATTPRAQLDLYCLSPGQAQKPHAHADQDKIYVVLEGRGRVQIDGAEEIVEAGEAVVARAGSSHGVINDGEAPLLLLVLLVPPPHA